MAMRIAVLGATGVYGRHLLPRLDHAGYRVCAIVRSEARAGHARACGAEIRTADIFDEEGLARALAGCDLAINLSTALRNDGAGSDYALNDRVRRDGVPNFLSACIAARVPRVIQQSIALVHAAGERWANEDTETAPTGNEVADAANNSMRAAEAAVKGSDLDWTILRGGLFYGPGTSFDDDWFSRARAGKLKLPDAGEDFVSLIHIADMATATVRAIQSRPSRQAYIVADDAPSRWKDVFGFICASVGAEPPAAGGRSGFPSWRVKNGKARDELSWTPFYRDYRSGLTR